MPPKGPRELQVTIDAFNRMQERLRRYNDDRVQMLAAISHDLRTSLTRLKLRLEVGESPEQREKMAGEIDAMGAMLNSILSFARDDAKREPRTLVDFDALAEGVCEDASDAGAVSHLFRDPRRHRLRPAGGVAPGDLQPDRQRRQIWRRRRGDPEG